MTKSLVLTAALLSATACNNVTYVNPGTMPSGVGAVEKGHFLIGGLIGHADIWANRVCPHGVHRVHSTFSVIDVVLSLITVEIYTPRTYVIECAQ